MFRKLLCILTALLLILLCLPACAETDGSDLCLLCNGNVPVGTGVAIGDSQLILTSGSVLYDAPLLTALVGDQSFDIAGASGESYASPVLLTLDKAADLPLRQLSIAFDPDALTYYGLLSDGTPVSGACTRVTPAFAEGHAAMTLTACEGLLPGAVILDAGGNAAGLVTAVYAEGKGRYLAYTNEALYFMLSGLSDSHLLMQDTEVQPLLKSDEDPGYRPVTDVALSLERGQLIIDWSAAALDPADGEVVTVVVQDEENPFFSYFQMELSAGNARVPVAPDRQYTVWVMQSMEKPEVDALGFGPQYAVFTTPAAQPFTDYQFEDTMAYVATLPAGTQADDAEVLPADASLQAAALETSDVYLQVTSTYEVTESLEAELTVVLTTPERWMIVDASGFLFIPDVMAEDNWHMPVTKLFRTAASFRETGRLAPGVYTLSYYLDGLLASQVDFLVE